LMKLYSKVLCMRNACITIILSFLSCAVCGQNVGIGNTSPQARLHVQAVSSAIYPQLLLEENSADFARLTFKNIIPGRSWSIAALNSNVTSGERFNIYNSSLARDLLTITGGAQVGIDQFNPAAKLHITSAGSAASPQLLIDEASTGYGRINFKNTASAGVWTIGALSSATLANERFNIFNSTLNADVLSLTGNGNVGIGTANPAARLAIAFNSGAQPQLLLTETDNDYARLRFANTVNTTRPWDIGAYTGLIVSNDRFSIFNPASGNVLTLTGDGRVGISTDNPGERLEVSGAIKTSSGVVKTNATGNANMLPVAYGMCDIFGGINGGTGNFTVLRVANGVYELRVTGQTFTFNSHIIILSSWGGGKAARWFGVGAGGEAIIHTGGSGGDPGDAPFSFLVFKN
jgi:hypothetical protein